ncbi:PAS domain S-box protein [Chitinophaga solisilvae]|uniref:PAS domain S-box protein n=1 Tax=Chitinophaga solisilvae TaxID=1233460 RepID=UPI0013710343|nr:PAS domain S-box protein [Chitinophaga solisilvae]
MSIGDAVTSVKLPFPADGGIAGQLIRDFPWEDSPLGPADRWPHSLKTYLHILLHTPQPMCLIWGTDRITFCNDACMDITGNKTAGQPAHIVWNAYREQLHSLLETPPEQQIPFSARALLSLTQQYEQYFTFTATPVPGEQGTTAGMLCTLTDITAEILSERQLETLDALSAAGFSSSALDGLYTSFMEALHKNQFDFPFAFYYAVEKNGNLTGYTAAALSEAMFPRTAALQDASLQWAVKEALEKNDIVITTQLQQKCGWLPAGAWPQPPDAAFIVPVAAAGTGKTYGVLITGMHPWQRPDGRFQRFLRLVAGRIGAGISGMKNYEESERWPASIHNEEEHFRHLLHGLPAAIYTCDKDGRVMLYNEAAVKLWGREPVSGKDMWCGSLRLYAPDGVTIMPPEASPMAVAIKTSHAVRGAEIIVERPDGSRRNVQPYPDPILDAQGQVTGAVNMLIDITDLKVAEEQLVRLASIVTYSDDAIISKTLEGFITSWNPAAERLFGYTSEEMIGQHITKLIPPDRLDEEPAIMERLKAGENVDHFETRRITKDGQMLDISLTISPLKNAAGRIIGASKIARDITEQRKLFNALQESEARYMQVAMEMEAIVNQRTRELTEANYSLEKSNRELEQFAFVTSHDLQEPLRKIHTFAGLLCDSEEDKLSEVSKIYVEKMMLSAKRMSQLIHDLLNFSRLNRTEDVFRPTNLNALLEEVLSDFEITIAQKGAVIEVGELPVIDAIPLQMNQLLYNLLGNALKFTACDRTPHISISARPLGAEDFIAYPELDTSGNYVEIQVKDNGIGFNQMYEDKIFQIFQRLNTRSAYEGTGIGLALCNKIALNHKGCIRGIGQPEEGATFLVLLPV